MHRPTSDFCRDRRLDVWALAQIEVAFETTLFFGLAQLLAFAPVSVIKQRVQFCEIVEAQVVPNLCGLLAERSIDVWADGLFRWIRWKSLMFAFLNPDTAFWFTTANLSLSIA
ncbi:hypothetical protein [Burkholderia sp. Ac-20365]|uniref:hypothetical protein n=1 Tax=Burkholderia sp. Ac-20365 TaxID=2703897 RepID=UPI00197B2F3A|nr:hypothetical protein [Burkholderia sp. Ac-20365]MBN3760566.1 hypothetical protein [Burkholderia sp. Ac-20365]